MRRSSRLHSLVLVIVLWANAANHSTAQTSATSETAAYAAHDARQCSPDGIAIGGYDVVAYHTENRPIMGDPQIVSEHDGLKYLFSTAANRALFDKNKTRYLPYFSGWCAIALTNNRLTCPDYKNFKIEDGKLLLFETIAFVNGRSVWESDPLGNLLKAERYFSELVPDANDNVQ